MIRRFARNISTPDRATGPLAFGGMALRPMALGALVVAVAMLAGAPALAQYKVVGPDGKITYTDRPPANTEPGKVTSLTARGAPLADVALPIELRQIATRYPVTLYTMSGVCDPCDAARSILRTRGIPYNERQVLSNEDNEALERLSGGRDVPTLTIGSQILRGLAPDVWRSYLDAAGYPRDSRLPTTYQYPAATPLTERQVAAQVPAPAEAPPPPAPAARTPPAPGGIKF